jgi:hypothetical protein
LSTKVSVLRAPHLQYNCVNSLCVALTGASRMDIIPVFSGRRKVGVTNASAGN